MRQRVLLPNFIDLRVTMSRWKLLQDPSNHRHMCKWLVLSCRVDFRVTMSRRQLLRPPKHNLDVRKRYLLSCRLQQVIHVSCGKLL